MNTTHSSKHSKIFSRISFILLVVSGLVIGGCSSTSSGKTGGLGEDGALSEADLDAQREARFAEGGIPTAESGGVFRDINFDYNLATLDASARQNAEYNAEIMHSNPDVKITLEGHCDDRGTAEYNLALGAERARSVRELLLSLGIPPSRIDTVSYGEEVPLANGQDEESWAKNRRVHFSAYRDLAQR